MKNKLAVILLFCLSVFGIAAACGGPGKKPVTLLREYTVTFDLDGGTFGDNRPNTVKAEDGAELALATYTPQQTGFVFGGWAAGENGL